ncbi:MAG: DUF2871 family protein [Aedoeadaptatus pacaensis]
MKDFELFFDSMYLIFVLFLGIRIFLLRKPNSGLIGAMTLLLGLGDSFHLIPRIVAQATVDGFEVNVAGLFLGTRISAMTMSLFYLLFYYYIRREMKKTNRSLGVLMPILFLIRIVTVILSFNRATSMDLISNGPFVLMGIIDIALLFRERANTNFGKLYIFVFFSFLFYVPVVLLKNIYPTIGMLMMPKTVMYVLIVWKLYGNLKGDFKINDLLQFALAYLFFGIFAGAFYREIGKIYPVEAKMAFLHVHLIVLGFVLLTLAYLLIRDRAFENARLKKLLTIYNFGMFFSFSAMFLHGMIDGYTPGEVTRIGMVAMSGVGHILLTVSLVWAAKSGLKTMEA